MKVGFAKKANKKKNKQKKNKKKGAGDGDDMMADVQQPGSPIDAELAPADGQLCAKEKQRKRMELKKALRVKVSSLKQDRNKLTKLAGNKTERRKLSKQIQGLLQEEILGKSPGKKQQQPAAAGAAEGMAE